MLLRGCRRGTRTGRTSLAQQRHDLVGVHRMLLQHMHTTQQERPGNLGPRPAQCARLHHDTSDIDVWDLVDRGVGTPRAAAHCAE